MDAGVRLLGPPGVRLADARIPLRPTKPHAAFVYLACRGGRVRRAELAALLWPDADAEHAQGDLRQALRSLSREPFGTLIARDRGAAWLDAECDVPRFRGAVAEGRWAAALELHGGPLLEGFEIDTADEYAAWLEVERAAVAAAWRHACRAAGREAAAAGRLDEVLRLADARVQADPYDELAARDAMEAAAGIGDARGASVRYDALARLLAETLGMAPEPATEALYRRLRQRLASAPCALAPSVASAVRPTIPAERALAALAPTVGRRAAVIGRTADLAALSERLRDPDVRLVTLLGPGGIGKTTLAAAVLPDVRRDFPDGVFVAPLEGRSEPDAVARAAAQAASLVLRRDADPLPQLIAALDGRRGLLCLDAFERHLDQAATVDALVRATVGPTVLVTSRQRLGLSTEVVVDVGPLATHGERPTPAARLFRRVAAWRLPAAAVRRLDDAAIERVAQLVGGHPLALELAALSLDALGLDGLEAELRRSWEPLRSDDVDRPAGRRDVRALIDDTWCRAADEERVAWARLAVVPGSLDRATAAGVSGGGWRVLRRLLDRGVLRQRGERLEMHALLARFGRERAEDLGVAEVAWEALLDGAAVHRARGFESHGDLVFEPHPDDLEQAVGAWRWAVAHGRFDALAEMAVGLLRSVGRHRSWREVAALVDAAVAAARGALRAERAGRGAARREHVADGAARAKGDRRDPRLVMRARVGSFAGGHVRKRARAAARAWALARRLGDDLALGLAVAALLEIDPTTRADERLAVARAALARAGDRGGLQDLLSTRGMRLAFIGRWPEAEAMLAEAHALASDLGDRAGAASVRVDLAIAPLLRGDVATARAHLDAAEAVWRLLGDRTRSAPMEAWFALAAAPREVAEARVAAFEDLARQLDTGHAMARFLRCALLARYGTPAEVVAAADAALAACGAPHVVIPMAAALYALRAQAWTRLEALDEAARDVGALARTARDLGAPRFVARAVLAAAELAAARGDDATARRLGALAWGHPALEVEAWEAARALLGLPSEARPESVAPRPPDDVLLADVMACCG